MVFVPPISFQSKAGAREYLLHFDLFFIFGHTFAADDGEDGKARLELVNNSLTIGTFVFVEGHSTLKD